MMDRMPVNVRLAVRIILPFLLIVIAIVVPLITRHSDDSRNPNNAEQLFRTLWMDPIPAGVRSLVSAGNVTDDAYVLYLRFIAPQSIVTDYVTEHGYITADCTSDLIGGGIAIDTDLERRIPDWRPYQADAMSCYITENPIPTGWSETARGIIVHHRETGVVYYNEVGR